MFSSQFTVSHFLVKCHLSDKLRLIPVLKCAVEFMDVTIPGYRSHFLDKLVTFSYYSERWILRMPWVIAQEDHSGT